jgi:hypothetical protein
MTDTRFRVVLTGDLVDGHSREAVYAALSRLFRCSAADVMRAMSAGNCAIDPSVSADEAAKLQRRLETLGAATRVERVDPDASEPSHRLTLPTDDAAAAGMMTCPACGHRQLVSKQCDECGVVFAEYRRAGSGAVAGASKSMSAPTVATPSSVARTVPPANASASPASSRGPDQPTAAPPSARPAAAAARPRSAQQPRALRSEWLDDDAPTEDSKLKRFMRVPALYRPCRRMALGSRVMLKPTWLWPAVVSPFAWCLYRKLYFWAVLTFFTDVLGPVLLIALGARDGISDKFAYLGIGLLIANRAFWPVVLKHLYCRHAHSVLRNLKRGSATADVSEFDIAMRGGTSRTALFAGVALAIVVVMLGLSVVDALHETVVGSDRSLSTSPPAPRRF